MHSREAERIQNIDWIVHRKPNLFLDEAIWVIMYAFVVVVVVIRHMGRQELNLPE